MKEGSGCLKLLFGCVDLVWLPKREKEEVSFPLYCCPTALSFMRRWHLLPLILQSAALEDHGLVAFLTKRAKRRVFCSGIFIPLC